MLSEFVIQQYITQYLKSCQIYVGLVVDWEIPGSFVFMQFPWTLCLDCYLGRRDAEESDGERL